jgi:hypothetical protein
MHKDTPKHPLVFQPDNEPYLGRQLLYQFDQLISSCLEQNAIIAPRTHQASLSDAQKMACIIIPQAISIALSIRELLRQGYLFGGKNLVRPLAERSAILLYLHMCPVDIEKWNRGWLHGDAPSLAKMLEIIQMPKKSDEIISGFKITDEMNVILHGRPESAFANLIFNDEKRAGYAVSKILNRPDLCDEICADVIPWVVIVQTMMAAYFEDVISTGEK